MSSQKNFKRLFQDFQIYLELNDSNVLEIQTIIPKTKDNYFYAIDKTYLSQHSQFFNITEQPSQLFSLIESKIDEVKFQGGKLIVPYGNQKKNGHISILLFRTPLGQRRQIAQLFDIVGNLHRKIDSIEALNEKITELKEKDQKIDQKHKELVASLSEQEKKITSQLKDVQLNLETSINNLKITDAQIQEQIKSLNTNSYNCKDKIAEFEAKYLKDIHQIKHILDNLPNRQIKQSGTNNRLCEWIGYLEQNSQRHNIFFEEFTIVRAPNWLIAGKGQDGAGKFQVLGRVGKDSKEVKFEKRYPNHTVFYFGEITEDSIEGTWSENSNQVNTATNTFKIYKKKSIP